MPTNHDSDYIICRYTPQFNYTEIHHASYGKEENGDISWGYWYGSRVSKGVDIGQDNGFEMVLDLGGGGSGVSDDSQDGLWVTLFHHLDQPVFRRSGIRLARGTQNIIQVSNVVLTFATTDAIER